VPGSALKPAHRLAALIKKIRADNQIVTHSSRNLSINPDA
jgi:hypothetical protein